MTTKKLAKRIVRRAVKGARTVSLREVLALSGDPALVAKVMRKVGDHNIACYKKPHLKVQLVA